MKNKILLLLLFALLITTVVSAFPSPTNYVTDTANVIDSQTESQLNSLINNFEKNTTVEIVILTIDTLDGEPIEDYAVKLFEDWGIGKKDINNGLLILVAVQDHEYRIEVGYGLEGTIPDSLAGRIARENMVPYFKEDNYGEGIYSATLEYMSYIEGDPFVVSQYQDSSDDYSSEDLGTFKILFPIFVVIILSTVFIISSIMSKTKKSKSRFAGILFTFFFLYFLFGAIFAFLYLAFSLIGFFTGGSGGNSGIFIGPGFGGGFSGGGSSGGFSGFGGGFSGGGGASGGW